MKATEDMEEEEVTIGEVVFVEEIMPLEEIMIGIEIEAIGLGDSPNPEKEK